MSLPPIEIPLGAIRFNSDSQKLEYWIGDAWMQVKTFTPNLDGGGRGLSAGGNDPNTIDVIEYITIPTAGNSIDFGNLTAATQDRPGGTGNSIRGIICGGKRPPSTTNVIDFITFSSTGNASDYGDLSVARRQIAGTGSQTRGVFSGGEAPSHVNVIDFVTIAATGNAVDFGDLSVARRVANAASSPARAVIMGGFASPESLDSIEFLTISTTGNGQDFGDLSVDRHASNGSVSSSTRAVLMAGYEASPGAALNTIDYVTIATRGNARDFGDLTEVIYASQSVSDSIRGVRMGGVTPLDTSMDYINISTEGNAVFFGDLLSRHQEGAGLSNAHGGLG